MKIRKTFPAFPELHRYYKSYKDLGNVINRSESYINNRLNGRGSFSALEKKMIILDMGLTPEDIPVIFGEEVA
ncbi:MAG: hypothetical protein IKY16_02540 [Bacteroidales bacterium]|nr:hypothetical protein [Bacteroidales bacterium]